MSEVASVRPHGACVVVAGDSIARFFFRFYKGGPLTELRDSDAPRVEHLEKVSATAAFACDRLMRGDRHDLRQQSAFLHRVAEHVDHWVMDAEGQDLVLCAPPEVMTILRASLADETRRHITCEVEVDLADADLSQIDRCIGHLKA